MEQGLILISIILFICIVLQKVSGKIGIPGLFIFIVLGMIFGSDGIFKIQFEDYNLVYYFSSVGPPFFHSFCSLG